MNRLPVIDREYRYLIARAHREGQGEQESLILSHYHRNLRARGLPLYYPDQDGYMELRKR